MKTEKNCGKIVVILKDIVVLPNTGGIKKFSDKESFGKILKVSHFYLGFS